MKKHKAWESKEYYDFAGISSCDTSHPAMVGLYKLAKDASNILDMGCGEGTRLHNLVVPREAKKIGIDISETAIKQARKKHKKEKYIVGNLEQLPFKRDKFDLVYSAYVLEHTTNPEKIISEAIRVLKKGGKLLLVAPNFGSPNRSSPPARYSRIKKFVSGFASDFKFSSNLNWKKVKPLKGKYFPDSDTTIEPYLRTLVKYLKSKNVKIIHKSSLWDQELENAGFLQRTLKLLSTLRIYPFYYWGPHLYIIAEK